MIKLRSGLFIFLFLFLSSLCFSQDDLVDQTNKDNLLTKLKQNLLQALKDNEYLQSLLNEKESMLSLLNQSTGDLSSELETYKNLLTQDISDLKKELKGNEILLRDLQNSIADREIQINQLGINLENLSASLTSYFRNEIGRTIRIIFIVGGITISVTLIGVILLLAI